jgi:salicylate hydroxylase
VLHALGLAEALEAVAFLPERTEMRHWRSGRLISSNPLGSDVRRTYGAPYYHIHRADLMAVLERAAAAEPRIRLHAGTRVASFEQEPGSVRVQTGAGPFTGALLVGADGIRSVVRDGLFGRATPTFTGNVAWRALIPADRLPPDLIGPVTGVWWGPHKHFVHYYVRFIRMLQMNFRWNGDFRDF